MMRSFSFAMLHLVWRQLVIPVIRLFPTRRQMQIRTLAHHAKMTLVYGQIIDFDLSTGAQAALSSVISEATPSHVVIETGLSRLDSQTTTSPLIPMWIVDELRSIAEIEPELCPTPDLLERFVSYVPPIELGPGQVYAACCSIIANSRPDIIFLIPWLVPGGADQGVLHHVNAALTVGKNVLVISTIDRASPWKNRLPQQTKLIELGELGRGLSESQMLSVLTRIVLQSPAKIIHIINSPLGWEMLKQYGRSLNAVGKNVFASVFCDDYDFHGAMRSYAQMYFVDCWKLLRGVMCDTRWYPEDLKRQYGVSLDKVSTVYFPVLVDAMPIYRSVSAPRILWAGRFTKQKRVDLLIEIAQLLPDVTFDVYGYAVHEHERAMENKMRQLPNVNVHGAFDSLESVVAKNPYSLLLYTSGWDGLPITLLDATIAGLPVVASAVGGVPEFISEKTGYPVWDHDSPSAYVQRINEAMADDLARLGKWDAAVALLLSRHTPEHLALQLKRVSGYLSDEPL